MIDAIIQHEGCRIPTRTAGLEVSLASTPQEIRRAQRLRWQVFHDEMGAKLKSPEQGLDIDYFDRYCDHLLVRDKATREAVACTRVLFRERAAAAGSFYSQTEFDMRVITLLPGRVLEVGRTCVRRDYRGRAALAVLWSGIGRILGTGAADYLFGCASIPVEGDGANVEAVMRALRAGHMSPPDVRVQPRLRLPRVEPPAGMDAGRIPPLLKAYLRMGAVVCGEPFWDRDFNAADVFVLVDTRRMQGRYMRHFMERATAPWARSARS